MRTLAILISFFTLSIFANPFKVYTSKDGMINSTVNCIEKGSAFIWIGTNKGINRVVFEGNQPIKFSPRGTSVPVTALEDDGQVIWVGLKGKGVYKMLKDNYKFIGFRKDVLGDQVIKNIEKVGGVLKVYTADKGFEFQLNSKDFKSWPIKLEAEIGKQLVSFTLGDKTIIKDKSGSLVRFNKSTQSTSAFSKTITASSFLKFNNGVLLASTSGLVFYDPSKDDIVFGDPKFSLSNFQLNTEDTVADNLDLNWDDHIFNYSFDFEELGNKEDIVLNYTLTGPEVELKDTVSALNGIRLEGLVHGDYKLTVSANNKKGVKAVNNLSYQFSIANPLRDSIWQYIIIAVAIILWTIIIIGFTRSKFKKDIHVLENALLEKTNKLNQIEKGKYGLVDEDQVDL